MKAVLLILILGAGLFFVMAHIIWYIKPSNIKNMNELNAELNNGQPTIVEVYSNL